MTITMKSNRIQIDLDFRLSVNWASRLVTGSVPLILVTPPISRYMRIYMDNYYNFKCLAIFSYYPNSQYFSG